MKVLIIGWDGATWEYIDPLLAEGHLPNLKALLQRGARAVLRSTIPPFTNVAWPSLVTGLSPAKTGVFDGARARPGSYAAIPTNLTGFRGTPLWKWAGQHGLQVGVLNVPMTYPPQPVNGYLVSGFDTPRHASSVAYPPDLLEQWARWGHPYTFLKEEIALIGEQNPHQPRGDLETFTARWERLTRAQGEFVAWLWRTWPVDLMFVVFTGTDAINHRTRDMRHIARVYQAADEALGRVLEVAGPDTLVCLVSDHGSTPAYRYISLYRILHDRGWLHFQPQVAPHFWRRLPSPWGPRMEALWSRLPVPVRRAVSWPLLHGDPRLAVGYENIAWTRTRVFARSGLGPLYVNLQGRYPAGTVSPGAYEALREEVIRALKALQDEEGQPLFRDVLRREVVYPGALPEDDPPDLVLLPARWSDHLITGYPTDPVVRPIPATGEYGTHTPEGIWVLAGPKVRQGITLGSASIVDVTPTVLAWLGLPIPAHVDGRVHQEMFTAPVSIRRAPPEEPSQQKAEVPYPAAEEQEVLQRLRDLGYL